MEQKVKLFLCAIALCTALHAEQDDANNTKIQTTLALMGFYTVNIDGNINTFESRKAISELNNKYKNKKSPYLTEVSKEALIALMPYVLAEQELSKEASTPLETNKQIQTSLRVLGYSDAPSDGIMGARSWARVLKYKKDNGLDAKPSLTTMQIEQLLASAKTKNRETMSALEQKLMQTED